MCAICLKRGGGKLDTGPSQFFRGFAKGWFPKGWFWRMFPWNENRNEGTFAKTTLLETALLSPSDPFWCSQKGGFQKGGFGGCSPGTKTGTRARSPKLLPALLQKLVGEFFFDFSQGNLENLVGNLEGIFRGFFLTHRIKAQKFRSIFREKIRSSKKIFRAKFTLQTCHLNQNHPFTKPPFYLPVILQVLRMNRCTVWQLKTWLQLLPERRNTLKPTKSSGDAAKAA